MWHADGYDKLKPFSIAINGCIDGFSRKVMWLRSGSINNNPGSIAHYMQCVSEFGQLPACLCTDCGTENGTMTAIQCALRSQHTDDFAGSLSHMYGTSTANQRIKSWWSFFRKQRYRTFKVNSKKLYVMLLCSQSCVFCVFQCQRFSVVSTIYIIKE